MFLGIFSVMFLYNMWQSWVENEFYSVAYFVHFSDNTEFH